MSAYLSTQSSISPSWQYGTPLPCNIRGRIIPYGEFLPRLKNYCLSLGFKKPIVVGSESPGDCHSISVKSPEPFWAKGDSAGQGNDTVIILSAKVPYEPSWGGYSGLPRPLIHERVDHRSEETVSSFIAPYLVQYQFARNHMYLACNESGEHLLTLPSTLLQGGTKIDGKSLKICLDKIVEHDEKGHFSPYVVADPFVTFKLSEQFLQRLSENNFSWKKAKIQRIGKFLTAELFFFEDALQENGGNSRNGRKSIFVETLLPVMNRIVTNANPQLRAALVHLKNEFTRTVENVQRKHEENESENVLCIAGLDIDVAAFKGRGKRYFVPWAAYWQQSGKLDAETSSPLGQDDLFVALMAQEKQCAVT